MSYVLGIDVGIKTLSMCVLSEEGVKHWGVYNILEKDIILCQVCGRKAKYISGLCGTHYKGEKIKKYEIKTKKIKSYSQQELCNKTLLKLAEILEDPLFLSVTHVIIELQPRFNPKMCFISNIIFTKMCDYYINKDVVIKFDRAKNKLKNYKGDKGEFVKNTYKNRKQKSIEYVTNELSKMDDNEETRNYFENLKKTDDASDSYLLALNCLSSLKKK
jgi:hypothetical protein